MCRPPCLPPRPIHRLSAVAALSILVSAAFASAMLLPGGGNPRTDCYVELDLDTFIPPESPRRAFCVDGDPSCDHDGLCNGSCTFQARVCVNDPDRDRCTPPPTLRSLKVQRNLLPAPDSLSGAGCGAFADLTVP